MISPTSKDPAGPSGHRRRVAGLGWLFLATVGGFLFFGPLIEQSVPQPEPTTAATDVTAPADEIVIEIVPPHSDYTSQLRLSTPPQDLGLTNDDTGVKREVDVETGETLVFEIRPRLAGTIVAGPWQSGPAERNSDGEVHALVTSFADSPCVLVAFEDEPAQEWDTHPNEPDYSDVVFWVYPATRDGFDTSLCPSSPVTVPVTTQP